MIIKNIIIVGGGSAGWMTCAALFESIKNVNITLIESKKIKSIGVGESTLPEINKFFKLCNVKDEEFMPHSNATYKLSIKFNKFNSKNSFHYPLCKPSRPFSNDFIHLDPHSLLYYFSEKNISFENFAKYYNQTVTIAELNKFSYDKEISDIDENLVAYHFEAHSFANYLRTKYSSKINHIQDEVVKVDITNNQVSKLTLSSGDEIVSDLYIDCTGFKSLLIGKLSSFKKFETLINDKAIVTTVNYKDKESELLPYTNCTALNSGWVWETPTWNRKGVGYVYSSQYSSDQKAKIELLKFLNIEESDTRIVDIKNGVHSKGWVGNVVSIGLSYGFIEPLESTGLATMQEALYKVIEILKNRGGYVNNFDIQKYNRNIDSQINRMKVFTEYHYAMSDNEFSDYWKKVTQDIDYTNDHILNFYDLLDSIDDLSFQNSYPIIYVLAGMGYCKNKIFNNRNLEILDIEYMKWKRYNDIFEKISSTKYESHFSYLNKCIYER